MPPIVLNNRKIFIAGSAALAVIVFVVTLLMNSDAKNQANPTPTPQTNQRYDANSGDTVSDPEGKAPDSYGVSKDMPLFLGFASLLDYGITKYQLDATKTAFYNYSQTKTPKIKEVSIGSGTIKAAPRNPNAPSSTDYVTFDVLIDQKTTYKAKLEFSRLTVVRLYLYSGSTLVYDSNGINSQSN